MNCELCTGNLTAYLDHELDRAELDRVQEHLDGCPVCREEMRGLADATLFVESRAQPLEPRLALWLNVRSRIRSAPAPAGARWFGLLRVYWLTAAAAAAAALAVGIGIWNHFQYQEALQRQEVQYALERYMSQYLQDRRVEEEAHRLVVKVRQETRPVAAPEHREYSNNPFISTAEDSSRSPFAAPAAAEELKSEPTK